jgi:hypothetical protein
VALEDGFFGRTSAFTEHRESTQSFGNCYRPKQGQNFGDKMVGKFSKQLIKQGKMAKVLRLCVDCLLIQI